MPWTTLTIPTFTDPRGHLQVLEGGGLPFPIRRVFWIHGVPRGVTRGGHAHGTQTQALVCMAGSLRVDLDDGRAPGSVVLDRPDRILILPPGIWAEETPLTVGVVYTVFCSGAFDPADYLRTREAWARAFPTGSGT